MGRWQELLRQVEENQPVAASIYSAGRLLGWSEDRILLGYPPGSFELQRAQDGDKRRAFEEECGRKLHEPVSIHVREITAEEAASPEVEKLSALEDRRRARQDRSRELREEAEGHPLTRAMIEKFGAVVEAITTEADDS